MSKIRRGNIELSRDVPVHQKDISVRSITPTTHLCRDLYKDVSDMRNNGAVPASMDDSIFYQDIYKHKTWKSDIVSFGINSYNVPIRAELSKHNALQAAKISGTSVGTMSNASSNPASYQRFVEQIDLTQYEIDLMQCAAGYLFANKDRKVVLVDTFSRELKVDAKSGLKLGDVKIPLHAQNPLTVHVVVLYKNLHGDILVIDPNNPKFSGHLQHIGSSIGRNVLVSNSSSDAHKIYTPKAGTGTGPTGDKYRDCIDLSVKLAALLDHDINDYISVDHVMKSQSVCLVSNNVAITKLLGRIVEDEPLRIKQVSHLDKLQSINDELSKCNVSLQQKIENADIEFAKKQAALKQEYSAEIVRANIDLDSDMSKLIGLVIDDLELSGNGGHYA